LKEGVALCRGRTEGFVIDEVKGFLKKFRKGKIQFRGLCHLDNLQFAPGSVQGPRRDGISLAGVGDDCVQECVGITIPLQCVPEFAGVAGFFEPDQKFCSLPGFFDVPELFLSQRVEAGLRKFIAGVDHQRKAVVSPDKPHLYGEQQTIPAEDVFSGYAVHVEFHQFVQRGASEPASADQGFHIAALRTEQPHRI